jgi:hypothetical protein
MASWKRKRMRKGFLLRLLKRYTWAREFTNAQAYKVYERYHARPGSDKGFMEMNVRNTLCTATHFGLLERVRPGVYRFSDQGGTCE